MRTVACPACGADAPCYEGSGMWLVPCRGCGRNFYAKDARATRGQVVIPGPNPKWERAEVA